jgi:hypothetical protein
MILVGIVSTNSIVDPTLPPKLNPPINLMFNLTSPLFPTGTKYQQQARQQNATLTQIDGIWHLYRDGILLSHDKHPWNALTALHNR